MKFESKISGTRVTDFEIIPLFDETIIPLKKLDEKLSERSMRWVMDNFYLSQYSEKGAEFYGCNFYTTMDYDTVLKLSVLENYPQYEKEFIEHFGENWLNYYIRFNH